jgi:ABC-type phosphate transport system substrate-binding protein
MVKYMNIVSSRTFNAEEKQILEKNKTAYKEYPFAIDGIGFIVNPSNPDCQSYF